jgi:acyl-[acyl carrier protein]--UDP-N-acetylglucosamine O-acyltransferase
LVIDESKDDFKQALNENNYKYNTILDAYRDVSIYFLDEENIEYKIVSEKKIKINGLNAIIVELEFEMKKEDAKIFAYKAFFEGKRELFQVYSFTDIKKKYTNKNIMLKMTKSLKEK